MKKLKQLLVGLLTLAALSAQAQSFAPGQILTAAQLNAAFANVLPLAGGTLTGPLTVPTLTTANAQITGGTITGLSAPIPLGSGGTGAATALGATSNLQYQAAGTGAVTRSVASKLGDVANILDYAGADCTGVGDSTTAINNALTANTVVNVPASCKLYSASGITIPDGHALIGAGFAPSNPPVGSSITCALSVTNCVTLGNGGTLGGTRFSQFSVLRASGTRPAGSIGVYVNNGYNLHLEQVMSIGHAIGFEFKAGDYAGIAAYTDHLYTGNITDAHLVIDTWPELHLDNFRFGMNGTGDQNCNAYIRVQGGSTVNASTGPNTLYLSNGQMNMGNGAKANAWLAFANQTSGAISDIGDWAFSNIHVESALAGITSDATWPNIQKLKIVNLQFNSASPFLSLNSATIPFIWEISNSVFSGTFTIAPSSQYQGVQLANDYFAGAVSITGQANTTVSLVGNSYAAGLTLAGNFSRIVSAGDMYIGGSLSDTSTATGKFITTNIRTNGGGNGNLNLLGKITGATTSAALLNNGQIQTDVTGSAIYNSTLVNTANSYSASSVVTYKAAVSSIGVGSSIGTLAGFYADSSFTSTAATNTYGFFGNIATATGAWNAYMGGSAHNYFAGNVLIGSNVDNGAALQVTGAVSHTQQEIDKSYAYSAPSSGGTVTMATGTQTAILDPASGLSALTVTLPACTTAYDGSLARFSSSQAVTTLTVNATSGSVVGAPTTLAANTGRAWLCHGANTAWYPLY